MISFGIFRYCRARRNVEEGNQQQQVEGHASAEMMPFPFPSGERQAPSGDKDSQGSAGMDNASLGSAGGGWSD